MFSDEPSNNAEAGDGDEEDSFDKEFKVGNPPGRFTCHLLLENIHNFPGKLHSIKKKVSFALKGNLWKFRGVNLLAFHKSGNQLGGGV